MAKKEEAKPDKPEAVSPMSANLPRDLPVQPAPTAFTPSPATALLREAFEGMRKEGIWPTYDSFS